MKTQKIAQLGMMVALAMVFSYLESLVPVSLGIPGVKLGLSNVVTLFALYQFDALTAFGIAIVRILLCGITFGNFSTMLYSMAGGILSFVIMYFLKKTNKFSLYGVSIAGGVFHNVGQLAVAMLVLQTTMLTYYLPVLMVAGILAGIVIGLLGGIVWQRVSSHRYDRDKSS